MEKSPCSGRTPTDAELPEHLAGIDIPVALELLGGKKYLYLSMLRKFLAGHKETSSAIRQALTAADWETAERLAHNTKGVAGYIGATRLQNCAAALEQTIGLQGSGIEALLVQFNTALNEVVSELEIKLPEE